MTIEKRIFAPTGDRLGVLGLGTVKFGRNTGVKYPGGDGFVLPDDAAIRNILDLCIDHDINMIDTAPAYGVAEERLGALMGPRRRKFFLTTKTGEEFDGHHSRYDFTAAHTRMSVTRSLQRLRTDVIDCVIVHSSRDDVDVVTKTDVLPTLFDMKRAGMIRSVGVSTYTVAGALAAIDAGADAIMVAYNVGYVAEEAAIDAAAAAGRGVFIKKALGSGHVADIGGALRFAVARAGVTSVVVGSRNAANILSNINTLSKG